MDGKGARSSTIVGKTHRGIFRFSKVDVLSICKQRYNKKLSV